MTESTAYLLDADAFIRAKRDHYGFDFCAGFWDALLKANSRKRLASIAPVKDELLKGNDDLADWVKTKTPDHFFKAVKDHAVQRAFTRISNWVVSNTQYSQPAKAAFLSGADPWLIAYANVNNYAIATYEVAAPESKASVKLPDVAEQFSVLCCSPSEMLRKLKVRLRLASGSFK